MAARPISGIGDFRLATTAYFPGLGQNSGVSLMKDNSGVPGMTKEITLLSPTSASITVSGKSEVSWSLLKREGKALAR